MQKRALLFIGVAILAGFLALDYLVPKRTAEVSTLPIDAADSDASQTDDQRRPNRSAAPLASEAGSTEPEPPSSITESVSNRPAHAQRYPAPFAASIQTPANSEVEAPESFQDEEGSGSERFVPERWDVVDGAAGAFMLLESDFEEVLDGSASASLSLSGVTEPRQFGGIVQAVKAEGFADQRLRFSGHLKRQDSESVSPVMGALWIRADDPTGRVVAFENSQGKFLPSEALWTESTIIIDIPTGAENLFFGATIVGNGTVWVDGLGITIVDDSFPVTAPMYDRQTTNPVPPEVLDRPVNLSFDDVVRLAVERDGGRTD